MQIHYTQVPIGNLTHIHRRDKSHYIRVNSFNCLVSLISYEKEVGIDTKLNNYLKTTGIINNKYRPQKIWKKTRIKLYNTLAFPAVLHGSENWTIKARDRRQKNNGSRDEMYEKNSRIRLARL